MRATVLTLAFALAGAAMAHAQRSYPPKMADAKTEVYKTVGDVKLNLYIFAPDGHSSDDRRPAIVFFFGGGWRAGSPQQFEKQCQYLASRGMVAMAADYRVLSRHGTKAVTCVEDGKSAVRYIRQNAARLGVDPKRVAAGGGSAGGHVAACTGTIREFDAEKEDASISSVPDAMVLFNPAVVLAPAGDRLPFDETRMAGLKDRMGVEPEKLSPYHNAREGQPPVLVLHGTADPTVKYFTAELFVEAMKKAGNRAELAGYEGEKHGFFNHGRGGNKMFVKTVRRMDAFLTSLGWLEGTPTIEE